MVDVVVVTMMTTMMMMMMMMLMMMKKMVMMFNCDLCIQGQVMYRLAQPPNNSFFVPVTHQQYG